MFVFNNFQNSYNSKEKEKLLVSYLFRFYYLSPPCGVKRKRLVRIHTREIDQKRGTMHPSTVYFFVTCFVFCATESVTQFSQQMGQGKFRSDPGLAVYKSQELQVLSHRVPLNSQCHSDDTVCKSCHLRLSFHFHIHRKNK